MLSRVKNRNYTLVYGQKKLQWQINHIFLRVMMRCFSLAAEDGTHLGLFLLDNEAQGKGQCALKAAQVPQAYAARAEALARWQGAALYWHLHGDTAHLQDGGGAAVGTLCREKLCIGGQVFFLNDMTGMV